MIELPIPTAIERLSNSLFLSIRRTKHPFWQLADWTLNLKIKMSVPPPKLRGYTVTNYCHFDPENDADLESICHDFVSCAVHSVRKTENCPELKITKKEIDDM